MTTIEEIVQDIRKNSNNWVLILGTGVSGGNMKTADDAFTEQLKQLKDGDEDIKEKVCQAIQDNDHNAVKEILYGNVWNFQYAEEKAQEERRKSYAEKLAARKDINMGKCNKKAICPLLEQFSGIILTTCQDETIEALLESIHCSAFEDAIYTPYSLTISSRWKRQLDNQSCMLIKLYGTCTESSGLLLSGKDMDMYYPPQREDGLPVMEVLERLFQSKNLLFIGMDLTDEKQGLNRKPVLAPGIVSLLERKASKVINDGTKPHRYMLVQESEEKITESQMKLIEEMGIEIISYKSEPVESDSPDCVNGQQDSKDFVKGGSEEWINAEQKATTEESPAGKGSKDEPLTKDEAKQVFWEYYNRRPRHHISKREIHILETHILKVDGQDSQEKSAAYSRDKVIKVAMAANRFAEFADLWKVIKTDGETEKKISSVLNQRIDKTSRQLHQLVQFYGDGFPMGFLNLMDEDEKDPDKWRKAAIRLDNSGAYVISCNRKGIYERMAYADALVQKTDIGIKHGEGCQKVESYLYPGTEGIDIIDIGEDTFDPKETVGKIFNRIVEILGERCEGYASLHALLETEFHVILEKIEELKDYDKKPELLYYLFRECQIQPRQPKKFIEWIKTLRKEIDEKKTDEKEALCKKLMLYQVQMIVEGCQGSSKMKELSDLYKEAADEITDYTEKHGEELLDESIFIQKVQLDLLAARIYGLFAVTDDKNIIETARDAIENREKETGAKYAFLMTEAECLSGDCQLSKENADYQDVIKKYNDALKFYHKYTAQYKLQEADVWLHLAKVKYLIAPKNDDEQNKEYLECLKEAYKIYHDYNSLHGIADVLQILGQAQDSYREQFNRAAEMIYRELGDEQAVRDVTDKVKSAAVVVNLFTSHG